MQIEQERQEDSLTLKISGRLDTSTAPKLQSVVDGELEGITELRVDIKDLEYVSSAGLRVLLVATKKMAAKDGIMTIHHVNEGIMEVFEITGFKNILDIR